MLRDFIFAGKFVREKNPLYGICLSLPQTSPGYKGDTQALTVARAVTAIKPKATKYVPS